MFYWWGFLELFEIFMEKRRTVFFSSNLPLAAGYQDIFRQPKNTATHFQLHIFTLHDEKWSRRENGWNISGKNYFGQFGLEIPLLFVSLASQAYFLR